jgi:hypothetical protein
MDKIEAELKSVERIVYEFSKQVHRADEEDAGSVNFFTGSMAKQLQSIHTNIEFYSLFLSDLRNRHGHKEMAQVNPYSKYIEKAYR